MAIAISFAQHLRTLDPMEPLQSRAWSATSLDQGQSHLMSVLEAGNKTAAELQAELQAQESVDESKAPPGKDERT